MNDEFLQTGIEIWLIIGMLTLIIYPIVDSKFQSTLNSLRRSGILVFAVSLFIFVISWPLILIIGRTYKDDDV